MAASLEELFCSLLGLPGEQWDSRKLMKNQGNVKILQAYTTKTDLSGEHVDIVLARMELIQGDIIEAYFLNAYWGSGEKMFYKEVFPGEKGGELRKFYHLIAEKKGTSRN